MSQSLGEALPLEIKRVRETLKEYYKIGQAGAFGAMMIELSLQRADKIVIGGDIVEMLKAYKELQEIK